MDTRICKIDIQFWAILESWGCREKNPNCHKYATFEVKNKNRILEAFLKNSKIIPKSKFF
jgi:hypothetical protein